MDAAGLPGHLPDAPVHPQPTREQLVRGGIAAGPCVCVRRLFRLLRAADLRWRLGHGHCENVSSWHARAARATSIRMPASMQGSDAKIIHRGSNHARRLKPRAELERLKHGHDMCVGYGMRVPNHSALFTHHACRHVPGPKPCRNPMFMCVLKHICVVSSQSPALPWPMMHVACAAGADIALADTPVPCAAQVATGGALHDALPMLLRVPEFGLPRDIGGYAMLGYGDVVLPGLLVAYTRRLDIDLMANAKKCGAAAASAGAGYFAAAASAYAFGLVLTWVALMCSWFGNQGQPALLYLVPCTVGAVALLA
mmetsp:Transcript_16730/g.50100  ORF Transcript_16730/g.50100 Transcript_16730/m.50100 type:complete len:311 (+) Transcript_16730:1205-2137(+)